MQINTKTLVLFTLALALLAPQTASAQEEDVLIRVVSSDRSREVILARVDGRAFAYGSSGSTSAVSWKDICMAPCFAELTAGLHTLLIHGKSTRITEERINLRPGNYNLRVDPGNANLYLTGFWTLISGLSLFAHGALFYAIDSSFDSTDPSLLRVRVGTMAAGGILSLIGIPLMVANRTQIDLRYEYYGTTPTSAQPEQAISVRATW